MNEDRESAPSAETQVAQAAEAQRAGTDSLQLAYVISHDLRARTRAIQGHARLLSATAADALDDTSREHLARIQTGATEADALLMDLVDWLRVDGSALKPVGVDLAFLADWAAADLQAQTGGAAVNLQLQGEMKVDGDERLLQLMMRQLLRHASAGVAAAGPVEVSIDAESPTPGVLHLRLRDNGTPCSATAFDTSAPFIAFGDSTRAQASGFSLAIARRVAQRHGGMLSLQNGEAGAGCLVLVELPLHAPRARVE